jgi:hypothetical protein
MTGGWSPGSSKAVAFIYYCFFSLAFSSFILFYSSNSFLSSASGSSLLAESSSAFFYLIFFINAALNNSLIFGAFLKAAAIPFSSSPSRNLPFFLPFNSVYESPLRRRWFFSSSFSLASLAFFSASDSFLIYYMWLLRAPPFLIWPVLGSEENMEPPTGLTFLIFSLGSGRFLGSVFALGAFYRNI